MAANTKSLVSMCLFVVYMLMIGSAALDNDNEGNLNIGVVLDPTTRIGKEQMVGIEIAAEDFNTSISNQNNVKLFIHFGNSSVSNPLQAADAAIQLIKEKKVDVIIGTETWQETTLLAEVGNELKVPILSLATPPVSAQITTDQWPYLVKMNRNYTAQIECIVALIKFYGWRRVVAVYEDDGFDISRSSLMLDLLSQALQDVGSAIEYQLALPPYASISNPKEVITQQLVKVLSTQSRVFVVLHASLPVAIHLFREANNMGLVGRDTAWITTDSIAGFFDAMNSSVISPMEGTLGVKAYYDDHSFNFTDFKNKFLLKFISHYGHKESFNPSIHALRAYDAIQTITKVLEGSKNTANFSNRYMQGTPNLQFTGLSGNISFKNRELEGEELRIVNIFGKNYKELDFWSITQKRFLKNLGDRVEEIDSDVFHGLVTWPGDVINVPKGWTMPTNAKALKIGVPGRTSFEKFVKVETGVNPNRTTYSGFSIDVFLEVVKILEESYAFPYEFEAFYGTYDELVYRVYNKTYDAVVGDVTILADRSKIVDFTQPYMKSGLSMVVPLKSQESHKAWMFKKPFSWKLWLTTIAALLYTMLVVWFMERRNNPEFGDSLKDQLSVALWFTLSSFFFAHREKINNNYTRTTVGAWLFVVFVLTSSYTASLTSILTVPLLVPKVKDIEWLKKTNATVGCDGDSFVLNYLQSVLGFPQQNIVKTYSEYAYQDYFSNGSIAAAFIENPYAKVFLHQYCKSFTQTKDNFRFGGEGFVFQKGSPLVADVSKAILRLSENGILKQLNDKWFSTSPECLSSTNADNENERLGIEVFRVLYLNYGVITTICFLLFATQGFKGLRGLLRSRLSSIGDSMHLNRLINCCAWYFKSGKTTTQERPLALPQASNPGGSPLVRRHSTTTITTTEHSMLYNRLYSI